MPRRAYRGAARERRRLRWKVWAAEFNEYLARLEAYLWPDLIILGGGVSKVIDKYREHAQEPRADRRRAVPQHVGDHRRRAARR